jgi:hypothetical protein
MAVSLTDALLFQGHQYNSLRAVKPTAVRFFSIGYMNVKSFTARILMNWIISIRIRDNNNIYLSRNKYTTESYL